MTDPLDEPGYLTPAQRLVVDAPPDFLLTACPGSGKTRTAGARFVVRAQAGDRVAATSYTNIGVDQIREVISSELGRTVGPESFIGTVHKFLLQYVFYPFAHIVMGCSSPHLVDAENAGDDVRLNGDNRWRAPLGGFRFRPDGSLLYCGKSLPGWSRDQITAAGSAEAAIMKRRAAARGRATFDDAMYWSLRVLRDVPGAAAAVAGRFDELLVDEAQDTSELQLACLTELSGTGRLRSLVLVGDVDQSIYAFQGATPQGVHRLVADRGMRSVPLVENHRSSQLICDVAVHFCSRDQPDVAVGEHADFTARPEIVFYDPAQPTTATDHFLGRIAALGIDPTTTTVLARNNALVTLLNNQAERVECAPRPKALGRAVMALRHGTAGRHDLVAVDKIIAYAAWGEADSLDGLDPEGRRQVRNATIDLITAAPALGLPLQQWIRDAAVVLRGVASELVAVPVRRSGDVLRSAADQGDVVAGDYFTRPSPGFAARSVHDVKGATREAVLVVARGRTSPYRPPEAETWTAHLRGEQVPPEHAEEQRILYVALTRARKYCAIALPTNTSTAVIDSLQRAGFLRRRIEGG
ncbi:ATP-dependent helicase [Pseudonocardia petroleophila]|uniref:ATP-dependent helicase n=1 Tax=Pseudonocardia petroleophila TaxID=37331 RepID=A0A7G7MH01_9PSEU|nr:ATP-dependent helicase [Pseudonocardia petroleophila]QNG52062.1 ATP-dependent helicase [Pseudonocardia petroleophila]